MPNVRVPEVDVPPLDRCVSVGMGVAATGAGLAISILLPRSGEELGAVITSGGLMLIERGITGRSDGTTRGPGSASPAARGAVSWRTPARPSSS